MAFNIGTLTAWLKMDTSNFDAGMNKAEKRTVSFGQKMQQAGKTMSTYVTLPILAAGAAAVKSAADFEKNKVALEVMLGSAEKAKDLLKEIEEFSATTPFQLPNLVEGSKRLLAFGSSAEEVVTQMRMLGDVSMGDAQKLDQLTFAFGKIQAVGKTTMRELRQFITAGVPIMKKLADQMGVNQQELLKMVSQGKVTFEEVNTALKEMTAEGGQFFQMTAKQAQTFHGRLSTLMDNVGLLGKAFGEILLPALTDTIGVITEGIQAFGAMNDSQKQLIIAFAGIFAAIGPVIKIVGKLGTAFKVLSANPWMIAIGALVAGTLALNDALSKQRNAIINGANAFKDQRKTMNDLVDRYKVLGQKTNRTKEEQLEYQRVVRELNKELPGSAKVTEDYAGSIEAVTESLLKNNIILLENERRLIAQEKAQLRANQQSLQSIIIGESRKGIFGDQKVMDASLERLKELNTKQSELTTRYIALTDEIKYYKGGMIAVNKVLEDNVEKTDEVIDKTEEEKLEKIKATKDYSSFLIDEQEWRNKLEEETRKARIAKRKEDVEKEKEDAEKVKEAWTEAYEGIKSEIQFWSSSVMNTVGAFYAWQKAELENNKQTALDAIERERREKIAALDKNKMSEEEYKKAVDKINDKYADKEKQKEKEIAKEKARIAQEEFFWNKAQKVIDIAINTASAIVKALPNIPLSIAVGAMGAAQAGFVLAQAPPPIPAFQRGGLVRGRSGVDTNLALLSDGEFVVNKESTARNLDMLRAINDGGNQPIVNMVPVPVNIVLSDGRIIGKADIEFITEESDRGTVRINPKAIREGL